MSDKSNQPASAGFFMPSRFFHALPCIVKAHPIPYVSPHSSAGFSLGARSDRLEHQNLPLNPEGSLILLGANELEWTARYCRPWLAL